MALGVVWLVIVVTVMVLTSYREGFMDGEVAGQQRQRDAPITEWSQDKWERTAREYDAIIAMIQDTGTLIWTINGAYLVALALIATPLLESIGKPEPSTFMIAGGMGSFLTLLWLGSFERNYNYYSLRIDHARSLEGALGFSLFSKGHDLGNPPYRVVVDDQIHGMSFLIGPVSIQWWTRVLVAVFFVGFLSAAAYGWSQMGEVAPNKSMPIADSTVAP